MAPPSWLSSSKATVGALIPEIVRRGFQDLLEAEVSALTGAQLHKRYPDQRSTHRHGYRERVLTTEVGDLPRYSPICEWTATSATGSNHAVGSTRSLTPWYLFRGRDGSYRTSLLLNP